MENKYFTPNIEDIRVGYECEWLGAKDLKHEYIQIKMDGDWLNIAINSGIQFFRVPYLTKEQIEAEGWKPEGRITPKQFKKNIDNDSYYELTLNEDNQIVITKAFTDGWSWKWSPFYSGECKDINTFRYICKLLKIQ